MSLILRWLFNGLGLLIIAAILPGFHVASVYTALVSALLLGLANILVKPILLLLTLPITIITLGIFTFVLNALMLLLVASIVKGFTIDSFGIAFLAAVLLWLISMAFNLLFKVQEDSSRPQVQG